MGKNKLLSLGITTINNLLDFRNYIFLEISYPFEFYDINKVYSTLKKSKFNLTIKIGAGEEQFFASNDVNYSFNKSIELKGEFFLIDILQPINRMVLE